MKWLLSQEERWLVRKMAKRASPKPEELKKSENFESSNDAPTVSHEPRRSQAENLGGQKSFKENKQPKRSFAKLLIQISAGVLLARPGVLKAYLECTSERSSNRRTPRRRVDSVDSAALPRP